MSKHSAVSLGLARAGSHAGKCGSFSICERFDLPDSIMDFTSLMPNKSPEPTAVGAVSSAIAVHVASRRWLSFFRYAASRSVFSTHRMSHILAMIRRQPSHAHRGLFRSSPPSMMRIRRLAGSCGGQPCMPIAHIQAAAFHSIRSIDVAGQRHNKSPEPMTVGRRSSASRVMLIVPSWLSSEC
jgi:hypothetical protein